MSVDKLLKLKETWQSDQHLQDRINESFQALGFSDEYVSHVTSPRYEETLPRKSKQIKDNQWGMIEFDWRAMRLVDCPLLQRLRYIKQLGFTYLTYPSAEHSRFSHSLGVGHVVTKFIETIDRRPVEGAPQPDASGLAFVPFASIPELSRHDLIHAALLHDIGHLPFSHVTEKVLERQSRLFTCAGKRVEEVALFVNQTLSKKLGFAEILTLMLILSARFELFYRQFVRAGDQHTEDALLRVASLIVGLPPHPKLTGLPELISSASVDADKVDYVNRDALNCGIPGGVDVARIFLRSGIVRASRDQIKSLKLKENPASEEYLFVVNSSGLDTIDEILQARTALYQRVYFHAVTRTAERLLSVALEANAKDPRPDTELTDALKLWSLRDATILDRLLKSDLDLVKRTAERVVNRQFPKKAYSFSPAIAGLQMPIEEIFPLALERSVTEIKKQVNNTTIETHLRDEHLWKGNAAAIEDKIQREVVVIVQALQAAGKSDALPVGRNRTAPKALLIVGTAHEKQRRHNQIICQNDRLLTVRDYTNSREQQDAFELLKEIGFTLCEEEWRAIVFFAARVVLARLENRLIEVDLKLRRGRGAENFHSEQVQYITRFLPDYSVSVLRSGLPAKSIARLSRALSEANYFDDKPWACEPVSSDDADVLQIAEALRGFDGFRSWRVTPRSTSAFLSQFPPSMRHPMVETLKNKLRVIDSQTAVGLLAPMLASIGTEIDVVPFSPTSGTQVHTWLSKELRSTTSSVRFAADIRAALQEASAKPIVFVDDNAASGVQARAQFLSLLGVPREQWPEECRDEDNVFSPLEENAIARLKNREVHLYVCAGRAEAEPVIRSCLTQHGFARFETFRFAEQIDDVVDWPGNLRTFLTDVGCHLVAWARYKKDFASIGQDEKQECARHAFGYRNTGALMTTVLSVPTGTVTALWQPGMYRGQPWMPLVLRTNKLRHLVIG